MIHKSHVRTRDTQLKNVKHHVCIYYNVITFNRQLNHKYFKLMCALGVIPNDIYINHYETNASTFDSDLLNV